MTQVFLFHIDLTLTVVMVTEHGRQYRLNRTKCQFGSNFGCLIDVLLRFKIPAQLNTKKIF